MGTEDLNLQLEWSNEKAVGVVGDRKIKMLRKRKE